jgi:hypothetical protein
MENQKSQKNQTNYPFIPYSWQKKTYFLLWVKRIHSWSAILCMLFLFFYVFTGWYLQHRSQLKIPLLGYRQEQHLNIPISWNKNTSLIQLKKEKIAEKLLFQTIKTLGLATLPIYKSTIETTEVPIDNNQLQSNKLQSNKLQGDTTQRIITVPEILNIKMDNTDYALESQYIQGNSNISITIKYPNIWRLMARVHMGNGHSVMAVLLIDLFCFITTLMFITGFLLWNQKNHGHITRFIVLLLLIPLIISVILIIQNQ